MDRFKLAVLCLALLALTLEVLEAANSSVIEAAKLKPEVLYIDLADPSTARGISLGKEVVETMQQGGYTYGSGISVADAGAWRWWTTFTYANYGMGANRKQSSFVLHAKTGVRWILVLPLSRESEKAVHGIREGVLAMPTDYGRLLVAEASLQEQRTRLEHRTKSGYLFTGSGSWIRASEPCSSTRFSQVAMVSAVTGNALSVCSSDQLRATRS